MPLEPSSHSRGTLAAIHCLAAELSDQVKPDLGPVERAADVARVEQGVRAFVDAQVQGRAIRIMEA